MPTADSFTALGRGNGFPLCIEKLDVSSDTDWITLGGTQKGSSPTQSTIDLSLKNAMKLFWNYNGHTVNLKSGLSVDDEVVIDVANEDYNLQLPRETDWNNPLSRVCLDGEGVESQLNSFWLVRNNNTSSRESQVDLRRLKRMYDGSTDNESNFVGYGIQFFAFQSFFSRFQFNFTSIYPSTLPDPPGSDVTIESTTLNNIPFLGVALTGNSFDTTSISGQTATFSRTGVLDHTIEYKDFDLYTY
tara:strand:- start:26 stop:760 length:735 start_codon:yes stop_codon:yes gene_type:complete